MKKIFALLLALILLLSMAGCVSQDDLNAVQAELDITRTALSAKETELADKLAQIADLQAQVDALNGAAAVYSLHATIDGQSVTAIDSETELTAQAVLVEGQVVDHWELNGEVQADAKEETFTFTASGNTVVEAVLRAEKKVTTVNCKLRFLNDKGEAKGDSYEEFVFEKPYKNPVTEQEVTDGTITVQVKAEIPSGYTVDYWKINGIEYHYSTNFSSFVVHDLDEATEYEVVLKKKAPAEPKPTEPAPTEPTTQPTEPVVYYKVTVRYGTIDGKSEISVPAGTQVTVVCDGGFYAEFVINDVQVNNKWTDPYVKQWTFTVNEDTLVYCYAIIN